MTRLNRLCLLGVRDPGLLARLAFVVLEARRLGTRKAKMRAADVAREVERTLERMERASRSWQ